MNKTIYRFVAAMLLSIFGAINVSATSFISEVKMGGAKNVSDAKNNVTNAGFTIINLDLNGCGKGGYYVYVGYKTSTDYSKAITGLLIVEGADYQNDDYLEGSSAGKSITYNGKTYYRADATGTADFNAGDGSNTPYLTLFYTRTKSQTTPLFISVDCTGTTGKSGYVYAPIRYANGEYHDNGSTNYNAHGNGNEYYLISTTHTHSKYSYTYNGTYHWHKCSCGYVYSDKTTHTLKCRDNGNGKHSYYCTACGYVQSTEAHTIDYKSNGNGTMTPYCFCGYEDEYPGFFKGDVNCDGKISISDVSELVKVLNGKATATGACRVNNDAVVDIKDVETLKENILNDAERVWVNTNAITGGDENTGDAPKVAEGKAMTIDN